MSTGKPTVSESSSKKGSKRTRGRPRRFDSAEMAYLTAIAWPDLKSHRGQQDPMYATRAIQVLNYDPAFAWICSSQTEIMSGTGRFRFTILAGLGRIEDDEELKQAAAVLCD